MLTTIWTCDTFFVILLLHLYIDVKVLRDLFATNVARSLRNSDLPRDYSLLYDKLNPELENRINLDMKELTKSLQRLLRISSDIESIFQHIVFVQLEAYSAAFFVQLQVYFALATQLSIYCIFAQNTSMAFSEIPFAIYQNEWFSVSKSLKSMMIINILRMNNPVVFTASKFVELSLPLLVKCSGAIAQISAEKTIKTERIREMTDKRSSIDETDENVKMDGGKDTI
nr:uncharacterized protein LOC111419245 [Onthophagus taurus]